MWKRYCLLTVIVVVALSSFAQTRRTMVLTFDDLPKAGQQLQDVDDLAAAQRITSGILAVLKAHRAPAVGFVNERRLFVTGQTDARIAVLQAWVTAGMELGNHTFSHWDLNSVSLKEYEDDVIHGEVVWR